ncbi:hypothetical protein ACA348_07675 [Orientia tsutsugamushi]|uniref:hypothetical protein n=1 Tax=Orientia tsutsugamushi TaxID=784 RepID=UPI003528D847
MLTDKYFNKENSFFKLRKYQEAIKKFNFAIKCNPDSAEAYKRQIRIRESMKSSE